MAGWTWKTSVAVGLVLLSAVAGGCGSDSEAAPPLTEAQLAARKEFVAEAGAFCTRARIKGEREGARVFRIKARYYERKGSLEEFRHVVRQQQVGTVMGPLMLRRVRELRDLGIPPRDRPRVERVLSDLEAAATSAKEDPDGYFQGSSAFDRAIGSAAAYGIESCAVLSLRSGVFHRVSARPETRFSPRSSK